MTLEGFGANVCNCSFESFAMSPFSCSLVDHGTLAVPKFFPFDPTMLSKPLPTSISLSVCLGLSAAAAVLALHASSCKKNNNKTGGKKKPSRWQLCWAQTLGRNSYQLANVRVPVAVFRAEVSACMNVDQEGLVECNITIQDGTIAAIEERTDGGTASSSFWTTVDCHGCVVIPRFADAHTHLVKSQTVPRNRNSTGTMTEAFAADGSDEPRWAYQEDVFRRMDFAAKCAVHHGTRTIRTHLDGCSSPDPSVQQAVYGAFDNIREKYSAVLTVQGVANLYLPLWMTPEATQHADQAAAHPNVVLGAYVGNTADIPPAETLQAMDALLTHAARLQLDVDLHIDESNDPRCCAMKVWCESLKKSRAAGYQGRVVLGHCCTLSLQDAATQAFVCTQLAALGAYVVSNPLTNLGLQDRQGSKPPLSLMIPNDKSRTPQWRGLTLLQELRAAGVTVACASDNVRDQW